MGKSKALNRKEKLMYEIADVLTLAPYPSIKEYRPMNDPVSKEYLIISI
jgi:hypothetical protein